MNKILLFTLFSIVLLLSCGRVVAHDPGTSLASIESTLNQLRVTLSIALTDIQATVVIDSNQDGDFSPGELEDADAQLIQFFSSGVRLREEGDLRVADSIELSTQSNENLRVNMTYNAIEANQVSLSMSILKKLPRGHRQYLQINVRNLQTHYVLSADSKPIPIDLDEDNLASNKSMHTFKAFFMQGLDHIFLGVDHILFLFTLLLPALLMSQRQDHSHQDNLQTIIVDVFKIVTAFTIAHSITLALALFQVVQLPGRLVEVTIAFSIMICAIHNLKPILPATRWLLAFGFGLIHGFGFANALTSLGAISRQTIYPLLGFNLGIEAGQLFIIIVAVPVLYSIRHISMFRVWIYQGGSMVTILIAAVWMFERTI